MIRFVFLFTLLAPLLFAAPAFADREIHKDSIYFTLDDGVMSPDEMEEEAMYVHGICTANVYQRLYFDCDCLAGAFLVQRERRGPMTLQKDIYNELTKSSKAVCANTVAIAGDAYNSCIMQRKTYHELATDNEPYCQCVGNKVARDFTKMPRLDVGYVENMTLKAMTYCDDPQNVGTGRKAADPRTLN